MNALFRLRKDFPICDKVEFKYLLYLVLLSNVTTIEGEDGRYIVYAGEYSDVFDHLSDWSDESVKTDEIEKAFNDLEEEGYIFFDDEDTIYLGELRGRKVFPFEVKNSLFDDACALVFKELKRYGKTKSAKVISRVRSITNKINNFIDEGVDRMRPSDFTDLHSLLYEIYTGGEVYVLRNKTEYYQTTNMLKAYDRFTVFSLIVFGTLNYDEYRTKGLPTMTTVACMKDDVFAKLTKPDKGSKDYMRDIDKTISEDSEF